MLRMVADLLAGDEPMKPTNEHKDARGVGGSRIHLEGEGMPHR